MFFPEKITLIKESDSVLEVGPGLTPHPRSDILLEKKFASDEEAFAQRAEMTGTLEKEVIYFDGSVFPFKDKQFDYVICSHVLEHVEDVSSFVAEMIRVGRRGYIEFPIAFYDYLYNYDVHLNFMNYVDGKIVWCPKTQTKIDEFKVFNIFFRRTFELGHVDLVNDLTTCFAVGFEWDGTVLCEKVASVNDLGLESIIPIFSQEALMHTQSKRIEGHYLAEIDRLNDQVKTLVAENAKIQRTLTLKVLNFMAKFFIKKSNSR